jgi:hypothetical protein
MELDILVHIQHRLHCAFLWVFHKTLLLHLRFYHRTSIFKKLIQEFNLDAAYKLVCLLRNMSVQEAIEYGSFRAISCILDNNVEIYTLYCY